MPKQLRLSKHAKEYTLGNRSLLPDVGVQYNLRERGKFGGNIPGTLVPCRELSLGSSRSEERGSRFDHGPKRNVRAGLNGPPLHAGGQVG